MKYLTEYNCVIPYPEFIDNMKGKVMRISMLNNLNQALIDILCIALIVMFSYATAIAKETTSISGTDLGSGRVKSETKKSIYKPSSISSGDLGSGRVKLKKVKS